ncbi:TROVE domain-containing protein [Streptomyces anulatus]|uniref:TROVE domain-containing protein n=1 Tax=Streptomyces anulatus TaxID=1892 RepID=UPI0022584D88|nr:TROVE domain-containing protein [Streptomyces anulatus]MCX4605527.1 TROVE domain-containing protein [Streptomyces anulatus]
MSRFNQRGTRPAVSSPVKTTGERILTHEGATGHVRDAKSELFLLSVSNFVGQDTFYEKGGQRDDRYTQLVRKLAIDDPEWTAGLLKWLRSDGNMRTAALVGAAEFTAERLLKEAPGHSRQVIDSVLQRADEPGEFLGYWTSKYGRKLPKPVKRGIADAVQRLYTERSLLKYDTDSKGYRFGDVLNLVHPSPAADKAWQGDLFKHALDRRKKRDEEIPDNLQVLQASRTLSALPVQDRRAYVLNPELVTSPGGLAGAGFTWERLAGWLQGPMDAAAWEAVIPSMGLMALARNLRNFDEAGVSDAVAAQVCARFADPEQVARSRMFPFRWWAAYKHAPSLRWGHALEQALGHSLANVPQLKGSTLILVDRSPSMFPGFMFSTPNQSDITLAEQAAVFGSTLALRAEKPTLVEFGGDSKKMDVAKGGSVLRLIGEYGQIGGTDIPTAVKKHWFAHDRIIIVTDEQTRPGWLPSNMWGHGGMRETNIDDLVPKDVPVYMWNMAGYKAGAMPTGIGNRHAMGGLTDQAFRTIPLLESGRDATWPWESKAA